MAYDLEEQEQLAQLKGWWNDNGTLVLAALHGGRRWRPPAGRAGASGRRTRRSRPARSTKRWSRRRRRATPRRCATPAARWSRAFRARSTPRMGALVAARFHFERNDLKNAKRAAAVGGRALAIGRVARPRAAAPGRRAAGREGLRRGADAARRRSTRRRSTAQYAALKGDVLVAKNQPAEAKAAYKLALEKADAQERARSATACSCASTRSAAERCAVCVARLRSLAAGGARRLLAACSSLPSMNPMDWFGGGPTGPKPAELPVLTNRAGA